MPDQTLEKELENDIIFGRFAPGSRIIEDRVMAEYGAKRHAVRGAFAALEARGLLVRKPNKGVEVVEFTPDQVDDLYDVRIILETAAAAQTPLPRPGDILQKMEEIALLHRDATRVKDYRTVFWLNQAFHELQFSCCGNARLAQLIADHARVAQPIRVIKYEDKDHMETIIQQHFDIIEAMRGTSSDRLVAAVRAHLPASAEAYRETYERRFGRFSA